MPDAQPTPDPRRRNADTHTAILEATIQLLNEHGYTKLSIEAIAAKAGVGKQTIYRWWDCKASVVLEAYARQAASHAPPTQTDQPLEDLRTYLYRTVEAFQGPGATAARSLLGEAGTNPSFRQVFLEQFILARRNNLRELLERAIQHGELRPDLDLETCIDVIYGAIWYRLLLEHAPLDSHFVDTVIQTTLRGLAAR